MQPIQIKSQLTRLIFKINSNRIRNVFKSNSFKTNDDDKISY